MNAEAAEAVMNELSHDSYALGYKQGYFDGSSDVQHNIAAIRAEERAANSTYFRSKLLGMILLVIAIVSVFILEDGTFGILMVILSILLIFSREINSLTDNNKEKDNAMP